MAKKTSFKDSLLSYFDSRKNGESPSSTKDRKLKAQKPKTIPNKITPISQEEENKGDRKQYLSFKDSIDGLVKTLNGISNSQIFNSNVTNNYNYLNNKHHNSSTRNYLNNKYQNTTERNIPKNVIAGKTDIFNSVRNSFMNQNVSNNSGKMKGTRGVTKVKIPSILQNPVINNTDKTIENSVMNETYKNKINNVTNELNQKMAKMSSPKRQYKATHASKKVPRVIELTHMTEKTKDVFKSLSNKIFSVTPGKTSSKILSSLMNYESVVNVSKNNYDNNLYQNRNITNTGKTQDVVGKEKTYNVMQVPALQDGAVVSKPTLAMIGEGGNPEQVQPLNRASDIQKTKVDTPSSFAKDSINKNEALKMNRETAPQTTDNSQPAMAVNAPVVSSGSPPAFSEPNMNTGSPKGLLAIQTQTHFPRWRRSMG